jgi:hypothetical protein
MGNIVMLLNIIEKGGNKNMVQENKFKLNNKLQILKNYSMKYKTINNKYNNLNWDSKNYLSYKNISMNKLYIKRLSKKYT